MKKILAIVVLLLSLFLSGCNIVDNYMDKYGKKYDDVPTEVDYHTIFNNYDYTQIYGDSTDLQKESYKFLKDNGLKVRKLKKYDKEISYAFVYENCMYYSICYNSNREKMDENDFSLYKDQVAILKYDLNSKKIELVKLVNDVYTIYNDCTFFESAQAVLRRLDKEHCLVYYNYTFELYNIKNFELVKSFTFEEDFNNIEDDLRNSKIGLVEKDFYFVKGNNLNYYEYKNGEYILHSIKDGSLYGMSGNLYGFEDHKVDRMDNIIYIEDILAFNLEDKLPIDIKEVRYKFDYKHRDLEDNGHREFVIKNQKVKIDYYKYEAGYYGEFFNITWEDGTVETIDLDKFNESESYSKIKELVYGSKEGRHDLLNCYVFNDKLFLMVGLKGGMLENTSNNLRHFFFEYNFTDKKLYYVGCTSKSDIVDIETFK